jgi:hypothetical protein
MWLRTFMRRSKSPESELATLAALGQTPDEVALMAGALAALNARYALGRKIVAEPHLAEIIQEFVNRLQRSFGSLAGVAGKRILDIACGSNSSRSPGTGRRTAQFEPWMCRLLAELGAEPVGVDLGDLDAETFEYYALDLGRAGALDALPTASFDAVQDSRLFGSPEFRETHGAAEADRVRAEISRQERRLLKPDGILIHSDIQG